MLPCLHKMSREAKRDCNKYITSRNYWLDAIGGNKIKLPWSVLILVKYNTNGSFDIPLMTSFIEADACGRFHSVINIQTFATILSNRKLLSWIFQCFEEWYLLFMPLGAENSLLLNSLGIHTVFSSIFFVALHVRQLSKAFLWWSPDWMSHQR